jgi:hypothetical protein
MTEVNGRNFGLLIAYVLPGVVALAAIAQHSGTIRTWFGAPPGPAATVGGFLYVTLASVAAGMAVSVVRWLLLDWLHHHTGIPRPAWDFSGLQKNLAAFQGVVENHYRYYQFYGNMLVAVVIVAVAQLTGDTTTGLPLALLVIPAGLLYLASRDALRKYYSRTGALLGVTQTHERRYVMTNGYGQKHGQTQTEARTNDRQASVANQKPKSSEPTKTDRTKKKTT